MTERKKTSKEWCDAVDRDKSPLTKDLMPVDIYMSNTLRMTHICLNLRSYGMPHYIT